MDNTLTFLNACRNGQKSIVQIFLRKGGIHVNKRDAEGNTALHYASLRGYRDIVTLLLDNDADVTIATTGPKRRYTLLRKAETRRSSADSSTRGRRSMRQIMKDVPL